jgi:hypothetical protein
MVHNVAEILDIIKEDELMKEFREFEETLREDIKPLQDFLDKQLFTSDVPELNAHMSFVESWRDRICRRLMLADAFVEHGKSSNFLVPHSKEVKALDREAYVRKISAGMVAVRNYLENLIHNIDSRVNQCKKVLGIEGDIGGRRRL